MNFLRTAIVATFVPAVFFAVACSESTPTGAPTVDGGATLDAATSDAGALSDSGVDTDAAVTDASQTDASQEDGGVVIFPSDTQKVVVTISGGFGPEAPDGSTCTPADTTYTLVLPARELSWKDCQAQDGGVFAYDVGTKTLTPEEYAPLKTALEALSVSTADHCGADKPVEKITVTRPSGEATFYDDFYACESKDKVYIAGLGAVTGAFATLAK